jgi:hypothetical protein
MRARLFASRSCAWPVLAMSLLIILPGCGSTPAPAPPPDVEAAKKTLERALTSWQKGDDFGEMAKASPPLNVFDPKWKNGEKLTKFELQGPGTPKGAQQAFEVMLWLTNAKGKQTKEKVEYRVTTEPVESVARLIIN